MNKKKGVIVWKFLHVVKIKLYNYFSESFGKKQKENYENFDSKIYILKLFQNNNDNL